MRHPVVDSAPSNKRRFVLVNRRQDQAQERLRRAPGNRVLVEEKRSPKLKRAELIAELIGTQGQLLANRDTWSRLWTEYQIARLALYRDLGTPAQPPTGSRSTTSSRPGPAVTIGD